MADQTDRFAIHAACREGKGALPHYYAYLSDWMAFEAHTCIFYIFIVTVVESLLNVGLRKHRYSFFICSGLTGIEQADPKLANRKDDDGRLPIHWAASSNQLEIVRLLTQSKGFDPDVQVCILLVDKALYGHMSNDLVAS